MDRATGYLKDLHAYDPDKPFFLWFTPGASHAPHQAPAPFIDAYRGRFDLGWDRWREAVFERQVASGLLPQGTELSERPAWVPTWASLSADERRLYARMMEVYAGFLTHTDAQVGRLLSFIEELGEADNTLVLLMSDNGASAEGGAGGMFNEQYFFNFVPESLEENLRRIDDLGTPAASNHYPWGWAWAGNTPLKRFKRDTHEGGVCDPLIVHWPARLGRPARTRHQYVHAIDVLPTVLDLLGLTAPGSIDGVEQAPFDGVSFAPTLTDERHARPIPPSTTRCWAPGRSTTMVGRPWCTTRRRPSSTTAATPAAASTRTSGSCTTWPRTSPSATTWRRSTPTSWPSCNSCGGPRRQSANQVLPLDDQPGRYGDRRSCGTADLTAPASRPSPRR